MSHMILTRLLSLFRVSHEVINDLKEKKTNRNPPLSRCEEDELFKQLFEIHSIIGFTPYENGHLLHPDWPQRIIDLWNKFCEVDDDDQPMVDVEESKKRKTDDDDEEEEEQCKKMKSEESSSKPGFSSWFSSN